MTTFTTRDALNQELSEGQHFRPISIRFKKVFTTNVKYYMVNPDWTTQQFYEFIKPYVLIDFELERFDIVEAGLPLSERAAPIRISNNIKIREMFANLDSLTFYIRDILVPQTDVY
jgi:hypothetical protein